MGKMKPARSNLSSVVRLRKLPAIFSIGDLCRLQDMGEKEASVYLSRWKDYEFVHGAGPRLGLYYNLIVSPDWRRMRAAAIARLFPSAVVIGPSVLHNHGWTTQVPQDIHVAILSEDSVPKMDGVAIFRRSKRWFERAHPFGDDIYGLPALTPEKALLDARRFGERQNMWVPDPDDLDIPDESPLAGRVFGRRRGRKQQTALKISI
ncbi:MAG: hypothetical protein ING19_12095 [Azospirillum sp.]|nr:hypothetical protein [Azospirillum sp.]